MTHKSFITNPKIAFVGQPEYFRFIYENDLDNFADVKEFKLIYTMGLYEFIDLLSFDADYNFFFRGEFVPNKVLENLTGVKINLSSEPFPRRIDNKIEFTRDSLNRFAAFRKIRNKPFDFVFHYDKSSLNFMQKDGLFLSGEFAFPVATNTYKPMKLDKKWDLLFVGRSTQHRESIFNPLKHHFDFLHIAHGIWSADLVELINQSRICLNVHAEAEISWEPRLQMLLACDAFVISEPITPNDYYQPGIDYIEITRNGKWAEVVKYYLNNPEERQKIAENGYQRTLELLDSKIVFKALISDINSGTYPKFRSKSGSYFWNLYSKLLTSWRRVKTKLKHKPMREII